MENTVKLSQNGGLGINGFFFLISLLFLVRALLLFDENTVYWIIGCSAIMIFEYFVLKNFRGVSFNDENLFLKSYFSKKIEIIKLENIVGIKHSTVRLSSNIFFSWLIYKNEGEKKEILFNIMYKNYPIFFEVLRKKGIKLIEK
jgi:hypothetical protein